MPEKKLQFKILVLDLANKELVEIIAWYMNQQEGLDTKFVNQFDIDTSFILNQPYVFPQYRKGYYQALMKTFPYFIVYTLDEKAGIISIVSVFHTSRHPRKKFRA